MNEQIKKDRELLEKYDSCKMDSAMEIGGQIITTQSLLEAQARVVQYEERQRVVEILQTWGKCDTPVRLALITIQDEILEIPSNHH